MLYLVWKIIYRTQRFNLHGEGDVGKRKLQINFLFGIWNFLSKPTYSTTLIVEYCQALIKSEISQSLIHPESHPFLKFYNITSRVFEYFISYTKKNSGKNPFRKFVLCDYISCNVHTSIIKLEMNILLVTFDWVILAKKYI